MSTESKPRAGQAWSGGFRSDIQALRALAVGSVLLYHLWPFRLTGGFVGVDVFFVISGYLITSHLLREREQTGRISLARFWSRRAARLLPASLLVLLITAIGVILVVPRTLWEQFLGEISASVLYVQNWRLLFDSVDYLAAENTASPVQHFWTLSAEEQFYVLLPLILVTSFWVFRKASWRRVALIAIALATLASFAYSVWLMSVAPSHAYFSTFSRAWEFGAGALLAFVPAAVSRWWGQASAIVGVALILYAVFEYSVHTPFPGVTALLPVVGTMLVIWGGAGSVIDVAGRFAPIAMLGRVSYAIYLWHWPLIVLVPFIAGVSLTAPYKIAIAIVSIGLAWLSTRYVEDIVRGSVKLLKNRRPRFVGAAVAAGMAVVLSVSIGTVTIGQHQVRQGASSAQQNSDPCWGARAIENASAVCDDSVSDADELMPKLEAIADDDDNREECWSNIEGQEMNICSLGPDSEYEKRILAIGDSHNGALVGAYEEIAHQRNWRIDVAGKNGCAWTEKEVWLHTVEYSQNCRAWRDEVNEYVASQAELDAIIVASFAGRADSSEANARSLAEAWAHRANVEEIPLLAILDNPAYPEAPVHCIATDPLTANERCSKARTEVLFEGATRDAVDLDPNAHVIDLTRFYCDDSLCPVIIGGVIVYRDSNHVTSTYARTLAPYISREVSKYIG